MLLGAAAAMPVRAADPVAIELDAGPLWSGLQELARLSGQRILVPGGSASLGGLKHPPLHGTMDLEAALDQALADTGFGWRRDAYGSILIVPLQRAKADLETLHIAAEAETLSDTVPGGAEPANTRLERSGPSRIDGARLLALPAERFDDLLRRAPNVSGQGQGLAIRGIERGGAGVATSSVYLDGIPLGGRVLESGALPPLQRVQYLRGPRSLWEGPGAMAGVIRLETLDPQYDFGMHGRASASDDASAELRVGGTGQIGSNGPALRLNAIEQRAGGSIDNPRTGQRDIDETRQTLLQGRMLYEPDRLEALTLRASWLMLRGDPGVPGVVPPLSNAAFDPFDRLSYESLQRDPQLDADGGAVEIDWRFGDVGTLRVFGIGARTRFDTTTRRPGIAGERQLRGETENAREYGFRWEQALGASWQLQAGLDQSVREVKFVDALVTPLREFFPAAVNVVVTPDTTRSLATAAQSGITTDGAFVQLEWAGAEGALGIGARRLRERRNSDRVRESLLSNDECMITIGSAAPIPCAQEFPSFLEQTRTPSATDVWVPNLRGTWQPNAQHRLGFELRRGFVGGGARLDTASGLLASYDPERSDTLDLTWSASWFNEKLLFDAALFYNRWIDRHVPVDLPQRETYVIVNAGAAHAYGGEFEVQWRPDETLQAWFGVGLLHTRYDEFVARLPFGTVDLQGRRFPGAPPLTLTAGARWEFVPDWQLALSHWYSRTTYSDALNTEAGRREGYGVLDLSLRRALGKKMSVELYARNALDRDYLDDVRVAGTQSQPREYLLGRERRIGVAFDWAW